jgi:hypothetical protein
MRKEGKKFNFNVLIGFKEKEIFYLQEIITKLMTQNNPHSSLQLDGNGCQIKKVMGQYAN